MKVMLGVLASLLASSAMAQDTRGTFEAGTGYVEESNARMKAEKARWYQVQGLYPEFTKNSLLRTHVEYRQSMLRRCVTVSREPMDRTCEVRLGAVSEEIAWNAPIVRETVWWGGKDMRMTWLFAPAHRSTIVEALTGHLGPLPDELAMANPNTWCAFQGIFRLHDTPLGVEVRYQERMSNSAAINEQNAVCGEQNATSEQVDAKVWSLIGAKARGRMALGRLRY